MTKFSVNQYVRILNDGNQYTGHEWAAEHLKAKRFESGRTMEINSSYRVIAVGGGVYSHLALLENEDNGVQYVHSSEPRADYFELINYGEKTMKRRTFKLTKELPELAKGALVQEKCDDGTQDYIALDNSQIKYALEDGRKSLTYPRKAVEDEPNYFVEVFAVEPAYMTQDELDQFEAFKTTKAGKKSSARPVKTEAPTPKKRAHRAKKVVDVETFVRVYNSSRNSTSVARKLGINVGNVYNRASLARKQGFKLKTMKRPNAKVA